jgi:hypothetical protein
VFKSRNVINVEVDGARYEVGPDVSISGARHTGRSLSEDFVTAANYARCLPARCATRTPLKWNAWCWACLFTTHRSTLPS